MFGQDEQQCLQMINEKVQGETEKLKNKNKPNTVKPTFRIREKV
jgi:hypothetical protein